MMNKHKGLLARSVVLVLLSAILASCSPKIVERIVVQHDTTTVHHRDTTFRRDSVYIREWMKGDTVYIEKYKDRYIFRDRWRDSVSVREVHDTTAVEVKVEKPLSWAQKAKIGAFPWLVLAVIGAALWTFRKYIF
ncbi:MAG: hypothetical protein K5910_04825 [Bacteroidales bacterium]|nr:hypothetical protein [Bacteroidales bacterium]